MATQQVQATIVVKSENFHQKLEESIVDSSTTDQGSSYEQLIAANERLRTSISKIFTEFVNKARLEQATNGDEKKRKIKGKLYFYLIKKNFFFYFIDDDEEEENGNDDEDVESSDNEEEEEEQQ